jgi:phosphatidylethanolamine/phosphatidyl-N-methylethanolamine N-methyltransferase
LKSGGSILLLDKFLRPGAQAPLRRLINPLAARIATRTDVVFEHVLAAAPELTIKSDQPALAAGWFRRIRLIKD